MSNPTPADAAGQALAYLNRAKSGEPLDVIVQSLLAKGDEALLPGVLALFYEWGIAGGHVLDEPAVGHYSIGERP